MMAQSVADLVGWQKMERIVEQFVNDFPRARLLVRAPH